VWRVATVLVANQDAISTLSTNEVMHILKLTRQAERWGVFHNLAKELLRKSLITTDPDFTRTIELTKAEVCLGFKNEQPLDRYRGLFKAAVEVWNPASIAECERVTSALRSHDLKLEADLCEQRILDLAVTPSSDLLDYVESKVKELQDIVAFLSKVDPAWISRAAETTGPAHDGLALLSRLTRGGLLSRPLLAKIQKVSTDHTMQST